MFGQRLIEQRGHGRADEAAKLGKQRGGANWLRSTRNDRLDMDREAIPLFRAVDEDRAVLRVEEREIELLARLVGRELDCALERVMRLARDNGAGIDGQRPASRRDRRCSDTCPARPR